MIEMQGQYFCALCMFNYTELKDRPDTFNNVLIETMKMEGFGPLYALALYQRVALKSSIEANQYVRHLADKNNLDVYHGHSAMPSVMKGLFKLFKK